MRIKNVISKRDVKLIKNTFKYLKKFKIHFLSIIFSMIIMILLGIIQPLIAGKIIEKVSLQQFNDIYYFLILALFIQIIESFITSLKSYLEITLNNKIILDVKNDMYNSILNLSMKVFDKVGIGEFISRLQGDVNILANIITNEFINTLISIIRVLILSIIILKINLKLSIIILIQFPINYILMLRFGKELREKNKSLSKIQDIYFNFIQQSLLGIKYIKTNNIKYKNFEKFNNISLILNQDKNKISKFHNFAYFIIKIINISNNFILNIFGLYLIIRGNLTIQYFVAFTSYSKQFSEDLNNILQLNATIQKSLVSLERIFDLINNNENWECEKFGQKNKKIKKANIIFQNVYFSYDNKTYILNDFNCKMKSKCLNVIVGKNGSGKTTIINLLLKLYNISSGNILINNIKLNELNEKSIRNLISVVHQQIYIFNLTIKENFKLINKNINDDKIIELCNYVKLNDYIQNLKEGYNTVIKENCNNLSGGQRQRLALALCLARNTPIIILDEITSSLDDESKIIIKKIVKKLSLDKTIIMITHDKDLINISNNIITMN
ncbi:ABC transporter ATP-binding protein/permease [Clostridium senegalense]|uniref:ABC transporter ATP-binding protein n=1 Tax=Clostridium senegalense TaxID=1465809 RepID=UPI001C11DB75|nr:ABC transporter ATP-binding protein [Clostridium senegalense]MBU5227113.1 ABC transporter ATP-binding protein/permease [Clostridium senegalense]